MTALPLLLLLLLAPPPAGGDRAEAERLFALGLEIQEEGDEVGAIAAYEGALATGWTSAPLHLRLAEAYRATGDVGRARLHAERAARLSPEAARPLLEALRQAAGGPPDRPAGALSAGAWWVQQRVGGRALTALALAGWFALMALAGWRVWTRPRSPWLRRALVALAPLVVALAVLAVVVGESEGRARGVVVAPEAVVRAAPSADAEALATLDVGRVVSLGRGEGLWRAVRLPDGARGWAEAAALEEV